MSDESKRACTTCVFCLRRDYGYSNYTVEGTELHCLKGLNPELDGTEEPYREVTPALAKLLDVALTCPAYTEGTPAWLDVDTDEFSYQNPTLAQAMKYTDNEEAAMLLLKRQRGEK